MNSANVDIPKQLADMANQLRTRLGTSVDTIDLKGIGTAQQYAVEAYIASSNDVLEFVLEVPLAETDGAIAGYLGWQAAGEQIARWEAPQGGDPEQTVKSIVDEALRKMIEANGTDRD